MELNPNFVLKAKKLILPEHDPFFQMIRLEKTRRKRRGIRPAEIKHTVSEWVGWTVSAEGSDPAGFTYEMEH